MSDYRKTITDSFGDPTKILAEAGDFHIYVEAKSGSDDGTGEGLREVQTTMSFTPERARKLAKAILKAAKVAEGNA